MSTTQPFVSPAVLLPTLLSSAILAVFSSSVWSSEERAYSEKPSEERPSQVVHDDTPVQALDRMVVTATLTEHSELTAPASVSVITAEDIAKMPVKDLSEAIRSSTGVNIKGSTAYGRNSIRIRGLDGKHTLLLINGRRINSQDALIRGNDFDLATIPLTAISRIEVVRGPVSSLYGSEAMGGVVNVILKRPTETLSGSVGVEYEHLLEGDGGTGMKTNGYISGHLTDKVAGTLIVERADRSPWRTDENPEVDALEARENTNVMSELRWDISAQQAMIADLYYTRDSREADWLHPRTGTHTNTQDSTRWNYGLTHEGTWSWADSEVRVYGETMKLDDASTAYSNGAAEVELQNTTFDFKLLGLAWDQHEWVFGGEYRTSELDNDRDLASGSADNYQGAVYAQAELDFDALLLTLGARQDFHEVYGEHFSPRAYAVYRVTDEFVLKGGAGGGFRAPGIMESSDEVRVISCGNRCWLTGNDDLEPEKSKSYELGAAYESLTLGAGITYFHTELKNKIERDLTVPVGSEGVMPIFTYQNIGKAKIQGVEFETWYDVNDRLRAAFNYTYTDAEDTATGETLQKTPRHLANLDVNWQVTDPLTAFMRVNYIGEQVITNPSRENVTVSGYSLVGLGASYQFEALTLKGGVNNLFNTVLDEEDDYYGYTEKGRSVFLNATVAF